MKKLVNAYIDGLKKWKQWYGRTSRRDYWLFAAGHIIVSVVLILICYLSTLISFTTLKVFSFAITIAYEVLQLAPTIALQIRRLHDSGRSGGLVLLSFVPYIGSVWLLVLLLWNGTKGDNKFGPDPNMPPVDENIDRENLKDKTSSYNFE